MTTTKFEYILKIYYHIKFKKLCIKCDKCHFCLWSSHSRHVGINNDNKLEILLVWSSW